MSAKFAERIDDPLLKQLFLRWKAVKEEGKIPSWDDLEIMSLPKVLPYVWTMERVNGSPHAFPHRDL